MESKLMQILEGLLNEFEEWRRGESDIEPTIIKIHYSIIRSDPNTEQGIINLDVIGIAIYSAIEDLNNYNDISRSLAVLTYHLITSHPFVDGNKRTAFVLLLNILYELFNKEIPQDLEEELINTLVEVADNPPEEDEYAINKIRKIIRKIIED
ncbi:type II toxin-antitoxin system death-on-curing family toxin [Saccharolobus solfataricus]|uniref:Type II toxin-antitoxin system death-on-curing family toxin n=2 Tax=Saccharolobus solfataricus TaxID=2287 RepID=A0A0E3MG65_SACSO|nr:type II toxin-antitoxin system death-on-curing family toxin [Saccharolobus solfataricus]AKA73841.1 type II toxin-antitoxin system death-on-curing family toxin [Saccharolobus solfataricus]AKA76539.1 type II toxin-antitoxin system death-on-curing family toxin [Saccharolobus solfataricus]AKA79232.1 type II toxin-antitoxin system death-on-curing family toxin [Saccharolobus solfataricus]AZF68321.1 type II toxin-antitoxin system death-on-curing family toxin [Saccharolobus solfataricus]AZF70941.1 